MHPKYYYDILGKKVNQDIEKGVALTANFILKE
jgi:sialic acid synthase SpsE